MPSKTLTNLHFALHVSGLLVSDSSRNDVRQSDRNLPIDGAGENAVIFPTTGQRVRSERDDSLL
jgi:hypothetical protein